MVDFCIKPNKAITIFYTNVEPGDKCAAEPCVAYREGGVVQGEGVSEPMCACKDRAIL